MANLRNLLGSWTRGILAVLLIACSAPLASGDVYGHWPLDDGEGNIARDLGPRMADGTIFDFDIDGLGENGSVWVNDPERGTVLGLGGNTAWVSAGFLPLMDLENDFSWAFWARQPPEQTDINDIVIGNRYDASGTNTDTVPREFIKFTPTRFEYHMNAGFRNDLQFADVGFIPSNDQWIHHSLVKDGDSLTYFRDGELENSHTIAQGQASAFPLPFALGGHHGQETWRGYLSDVQLYASSLTQQEIQNTVMAGSVVDNADLYARYELNDGAGSTASGTGSDAVTASIINADTGGLAPDGSVWVDDPERGTVLGLSGTGGAWVDAGELPIMDLEQDFTWNFWARQDAFQASPSDVIIVGNRYDITQVDTVPPEWIKFTPNRVEFHMNDSSEGDLAYREGESGIPSNDEWNHHLVVKDGNQLAYYRNGELATVGPVFDPMFSSEPLPFGMGGQNGAEGWRGYLSDVRLFDHALSAGEIAELSGGEVGGITGDFNNNGLVEQEDLDLVLANWGESAGNAPPTWTNDPPEGNIDQTELDKVLANWGNTAALGSANGVPEPTTFALLAISLASFSCVRRARRSRIDARAA